MRKIKIKNFGPIKEGLVEGDGFLEVKKVTVFTGNQATGKSTVAKLISVLSWIEKALFRGTILPADALSFEKFVNSYCHYQGLREYFKTNTEIHYQGEVYDFHVFNGSIESKTHDRSTPFRIPKIMYVPAERNFLSAVHRPERLKGLPSPVYTFLEEFEIAQDELIGSLPLPINGIQFEFQKFSKTGYVIGNDYRLKLNEASSGLHSAVPLYLVSRNLALSMQKQLDESKMELSLEDNKKLRHEIESILLNENLSAELKRSALEVISSKYKNGCFINIVEEMEQNLYPSSQMSVFFSLLEFANLTDGNMLILTTHSPYLINFLTLAIKAKEVGELVKDSVEAARLQDELDQIVPRLASVRDEDSGIYEFGEDGVIRKLESFHGIPSDRNLLNQSLGEANEMFDRLLSIEQSL